jgi:hypothetical protein
VTEEHGPETIVDFLEGDGIMAEGVTQEVEPVA